MQCIDYELKCSCIYTYIGLNPRNSKFRVNEHSQSKLNHEITKLAEHLYSHRVCFMDRGNPEIFASYSHAP